MISVGPITKEFFRLEDKIVEEILIPKNKFISFETFNSYKKWCCYWLQHYDVLKNKQLDK